MAELSTLSDFDLASLLHETMERHDRLVDSAPMGDERIYFADKECNAIKEEQRRRGYEPCSKCFDFGDAEFGEAYCDCAMGDRLKEKYDRGRPPREPQTAGVLDRLEEIAKAQKAYHDRKQQEFPSIDDFLDEDGELRLPADIGPLLSQSSYNGRYSEADWWLSTIQKMKAAVDPTPKPQTSAEPFAWYWYDATGALMITGDARRPEVPVGAKPLYEQPAPPRESQKLVTHIRPSCDGDPLCYAYQVCAFDHEDAQPVY